MYKRNRVVNITELLDMIKHSLKVELSSCVLFLNYMIEDVENNNLQEIKTNLYFLLDTITNIKKLIFRIIKFIPD